MTAFVSSLAARGVSASTQNQALSAILFLYEVVIGQRLPWMQNIVRAQRPLRLPVVLSCEEVASLLSRLRGPVWLMASLLYGAGLRLIECAELRVKDFNFDRGELTVRDGKGGKDRVTMLPAAVKRPLADHLTRVKAQHDADVAAGRGSVALPGALRTKYPGAPLEWAANEQTESNVKIPGAERAVVDAAKVRDYLLSPEHRVGSAKARFFTQLGFEQRNWTVLQQELQQFATQEAQLGRAMRFGQKYVVAGTIQGPAGRGAALVVVWIVLEGENFPRFVTAYPGAKS